MIESAVTDLPEPDSPTMPSVSPGLERKRKAVDGRYRTVFGTKRRAEVLDLEQRHSLAEAVRCR